jgi:hypothetical protein
MNNLLTENNNPKQSTPLVRERSVVQSHAAAPETLDKSGVSDCPEYPYLSIDDATEHEHAPSRRAESVRDVLEAFEGWLDQQVLPPDIAEHANFVLAYLRMEQPLPAPLRAKLAEHVATVSTGRL